MTKRASNPPPPVAVKPAYPAHVTPEQYAWLLEHSRQLNEQAEALAKDRDSWREATARAVSLLQLNNVPIPTDLAAMFLKAQAEVRAEALEAEANLILQWPRDTPLNEQKLLGRIASAMKYRANRIRQGGDV